MIGEKALGAKLATRIDDYAKSYRDAAMTDKVVGTRNHRMIVADVLAAIANAIRDVTQ